MTMRGRRFWVALLGEERPSHMMLLLTLLVLLLHVWLLTWLMRPVEKITEAVPLVMEVSMIAISAPKPAAAPPKPAPPPPEKKPPPPKKTPPKPVVKKTPLVVQKAPDFAPAEPVEPAPAPTPQVTQSASTSNAAPSQAVSTNTAETFTEANFRANYAHNPKPEYPTIAKSRGWQGKVLLRVKVSAEGLSDAVAVEQSSGHEILDESAIEAVQKWRFIPAKRGETPVASSVIVPIVFTLRN
ncbi:energy transducer TonB [Methylomonas sp. LL1]|uniref:energy transducer TonB n=1 Tax=Methylomonas sp. LL1 TaxID=2785785 RepID=UPI0018C3E72B|nr:energy transducer TonB [Methylomonas sp. LL1]QPK62301.1 energy transducer TonB [Methylomonas sp. LL1]